MAAQIHIRHPEPQDASTITKVLYESFVRFEALYTRDDPALGFRL